MNLTAPARAIQAHRTYSTAACKLNGKFGLTGKEIARGPVSVRESGTVGRGDRKLCARLVTPGQGEYRRTARMNRWTKLDSVSLAYFKT